MASIYAHLKKLIPKREPTERDEAVEAAKSKYRDSSLAEMTQAYNHLAGAKAELSKQVKALDAEIDALETLIREHLESSDTDAVSMGGFTWSAAYEPVPVVESSPEDVEDYFREHGLEHLLHLNKTELGNRLKALVKEEALNNTLQVRTRKVVDPSSGEEVEVQDVYSKIPGVRVWMDHKLSRRSSGKAQRSR